MSVDCDKSPPDPAVRRVSARIGHTERLSNWLASLAELAEALPLASTALAAIRC